MTTNKPEVVAWYYKHATREHLKRLMYRPMHKVGENYEEIELIRLSDYKKLAAEFEKLRKEAGTERQIQRAAQHLPEGWRIIVEVERDAGWIDAFNPDGRRIEIDWVGSLAEQIEQAIDTAMQEAAHESH